MSLMTLSVRERRNEVGLRVAVGARRRDVRTQFLVEAVAVTGLGSLTGLALSLVAVAAIARWTRRAGRRALRRVSRSPGGLVASRDGTPSRMTSPRNPLEVPMHRSNRLAALTLAALVAVPAALTARGHAPELSGEWDLEFAAPWGMVVWTFDLEQEGTAISGTANPGMGTMVLEGTVTDHAIEFRLDRSSSRVRSQRTG
jgi:ABC-type antimicrobial peptide transport system permease subunit